MIKTIDITNKIGFHTWKYGTYYIVFGAIFVLLILFLFEINSGKLGEKI